MNARVLLLRIAAALTGLLLCCSISNADDFKDFAELDLEELLNTEVYSASKREQKISEAPNAISVITAEDIKRSGAVNVPDLLRMIPGVDVVNAYGNTFGVSARGFNERLARRMLVVIDGRSAYTAFSGGAFWESDQVFLEDIERIEVIRGPGATLWGTNAVNGVINIITKDPESDQGLMLTGKGGTQGFGEGIARYAGNATDKLSVSVTGGYRQSQGTSEVKDYYEIPKASARVKYKFSDDSTLQGFALKGTAQRDMPKTVFTPRIDTDGDQDALMLKWENVISDTSRFHLLAYRNYYDITSHRDAVDIEEEEYVTEMQHSFALGSRQQITWGLNYYNAAVDSNYLRPKDDHDDTVSTFIQDEIRIFNKLKFIAGGSYEKNSFTGGDFSPRGTLMYSPSSNHHLRFSISQAFQTPSFAKNGFYLPQTLPSPLPPLTGALVLGNNHLDTEKMTALELGYRTILLDRAGLNVELYYNEIDDVVTEVVQRPYTFPLKITWDNAYDSIAKGVEIDVDVPITGWWTATANYTFQQVEDLQANHQVQGTPKHKFNLGSSFTFKKGFSFDVRAHYVDETRWRPVLGRRVDIDDYVRLDMRIAQKLFKDKVELSLAGQNLTDRTHPETSDGVATYNSERLIYGQVSFYFR